MTRTVELSAAEMSRLEGGGFWGGVGCGLGLVASFAIAVSPEPFTKVAFVSYAGTVISCVTAWGGA